MKNDLVVLRSDGDAVRCDDLLIELANLGAITTSASCSPIESMSQNIEILLEDNSFVFVLATATLVGELRSKDVVIDGTNPAILPFAIGLHTKDPSDITKNIPSVCISSARSMDKLALEVLRAIASSPVRERLRAGNLATDIWRTPLYVYRKKDAFLDRDILVDVTWSSKPTRPGMAPSLERALRITFDHIGRHPLRILDFGAGKLRHTVPLLELGHNVTAIDYRTLYDNPTAEIGKNIIKARKYGTRFGRLVYPCDIVEHGDKYDLIMLVNVLNIMPDPLERLFVLDCCERLLENEGHLLWFCQHGDVDQIATTADSVTDGGCTSGKG